MAGIYIHVPFCKKRCHYCDFYSSVNLKLADGFKNSLISEIAQNKNFFRNSLQEPLNILTQSSISDQDKSTIGTLYFGGGTPSLLNQNTLKEIFAELKNNFHFSEDIEITFEVNPDDVTVKYCKMLLEFGANRLSIGVQSFDNEQLKFMNRRHDAAMANESISNAIKAGFSNISIDLIYGLPGMSIENWRETLTKTFSFPIKHLSAYHLTIEEGTVFYKLEKSGRISTANEEESLNQFELLHEIATLNGFVHYEISNFAKPGNYSNHNSNYWNGSKYLGLGPSAHSYNRKIRRWNISSVEKYIRCINNPEKLFDLEELRMKDKLNEYTLTSLRTNWGMDLHYFHDTFGDENYKYIFKILKKYSESGHVFFENEKAIMTLKGWFISDRIISEMIL